MSAFAAIGGKILWDKFCDAIVIKNLMFDNHHCILTYVISVSPGLVKSTLFCAGSQL
jgi:hypothetical protein